MPYGPQDSCHCVCACLQSSQGPVICAMALLPPLTGRLLMPSKLFLPLWLSLDSFVYHSHPEPTNHFCGWLSPIPSPYLLWLDV